MLISAQLKKKSQGKNLHGCASWSRNWRPWLHTGLFTKADSQLFPGRFWPHSQEHPEWGGLPPTQAQILIMFLNFHVKM